MNFYLFICNFTSHPAHTGKKLGGEGLYFVEEVRSFEKRVGVRYNGRIVCKDLHGTVQDRACWARVKVCNFEGETHHYNANMEEGNGEKGRN